MSDTLMSEDSSIGEAVSARGEAVSDEDENVYYIPERRPSLDLGETPMDTINWAYVEQALTPAQSYGSMNSEEDLVTEEHEPFTRVLLGRVDSFSSCYSIDSNDCEMKTFKVKNEEDASAPSDTLQSDVDPNEVSHPSLTIPFTFKAISETLKRLSQGELDTFKRMLWIRFPQSFTASPQSIDMVDLVDRLLECYSLEASLKTTKTLLIEMNKNKEVEFLQTLCLRNEVRYDLSEVLRKEYGEMCESSDTEGEKRPFDDVYTDLYILSQSENGPNVEHEVLTLKRLGTPRREGVPIPTNDIFFTQQPMKVKLSLLTGAAGSGKSMAVRRVILDWVEGKAYDKFVLMIPLPLRQLKQFERLTEVSLVDIITQLYPATAKLNPEDFRGEDCKIMYIFDGLDEYNQELDFWNTELLSDPRHRTTLNVILVNIFRGRMLCQAYCLVASRTRTKSSIPWDTLHDHIEILGFRDPEKEEYFRRRFKDKDQAAKVIEYVKASKTLHIMCHLPLFCSLLGDECQRIFREQGSGAKLPRGITYMYTKLLLELIRRRRTLRAPDRSPEEEREFLLKLGKLAWMLLEKVQFRIHKQDWEDKGSIDEEAVVHSGLCIQYVIIPQLFHTEKVMSFLHPTMQEYLAALYAYLSFTHKENVIFEPKALKTKIKVLKGKKLLELYKCAVDRSLQCEDGKLDLFLRFLFGMWHKTNQEFLQPLCSSAAKSENFADEAAAFIRKRIRENQHPNRNSNLQHCLEELGV